MRLHAKERSWRGPKFGVWGDNIHWRKHQLNGVYFFTIGIVRNICHFGYIVFLSCMFMALKDLIFTRKKYKIAKVTNILDQSHCKK